MKKACKYEFKNQWTINTLILEISNELRGYMYSLSQKKREELANKDSFKSIGSKMVFLRIYFLEIRRKYINTNLDNQLNFSYTICITLFIIGIIIDIISLILYRHLILMKLNELSVIYINILNILKR